MKNLKNLGKALNKNEQKEINGGRQPVFNGTCQTSGICYYGSDNCCTNNGLCGTLGIDGACYPT